MFDIGTHPVNPCDSQLNLNMIDDVTFSKVIQAEMWQDKKQRQKIGGTKAALEALHLNLFVSEVIITV